MLPGGATSSTYTYPTPTEVPGLSFADDLFALGSAGTFCAKDASGQVICGRLTEPPYGVVTGVAGNFVGLSRHPLASVFYAWTLDEVPWRFDISSVTGLLLSFPTRLTQFGGVSLGGQRAVEILNGYVVLADGRILGAPMDLRGHHAVSSVDTGTGCAIRDSDSRVVCWGRQGDGTFGAADEDRFTTTPELVTFPN